MSKQRLQLDFPKEGIRELDEMQQIVGVESRAQLIRFALKMLQWYLKVRLNGGHILVENGGRVERIVFPFMETPEFGIDAARKDRELAVR